MLGNLNNSNLKNLLSEYEKKRLNAIYEAEKRKEQIYKENPGLEEIDDALSKEAIRVSKLLIASKDTTLLEGLNKKISDLKNEKVKILNSIGKDINYLKPIYECKACEDTGYITKNYNTTMCHCLKQKLFNIEYNIYNLEKQNFNTFSSNLYSDEANEKKYNSKISPKENIEKIKKLCLNFIENFDSEEEKNLLFTGNTGLGKSFIKLYSK